MTTAHHHYSRAKARQLIKTTWQSQANLAFFLALLVTTGFVLPSLGFGRSDLRLYSDIVFGLTLISGVAIGWGERFLFPLAVVVAAVTLAVRTVAFWHQSFNVIVWVDALSMASTLVISLILLAQVFRKGTVTHLRLQGAIAVYILFGAGWAHAYHLAAVAHPGAFSSPPGELSTVGDWSYYSFVTLTTLGYGDITPVSAVARSLAVGEALAGQLYLAVLIARLVAMEVIGWQERASSSSDH